MLGVTIGTTILYLLISLVYLCFIEHKARKTHISLCENKITIQEATEKWNHFSDSTSTFMLIKLIGIIIMVVLFAMSYIFMYT